MWEPSRNQNMNETKMKEWDRLAGRRGSLTSVHWRHVSNDDVDMKFTGASSENKSFGGLTRQWLFVDCAPTAPEWLVFFTSEKALKTNAPRPSCSEQLSRIRRQTIFLQFGSPDSLFHRYQQCQDQYAPQSECTFTKPAAFVANVPSSITYLALCWSLYSLMLSKQTKKIHLFCIRSGFCWLATCDNHWGCKEIKELTAVCWPL